MTNTPIDDPEMERRIQATNPSSQRITPTDILNAIDRVYYFTADELTGDAELKTMTFCILVLKNGFFVTDHSAPVDPNNFNPEIGKQVAYKRACDQLWPLLGYALKEKLHDAQS